jgi:hypothetical protein
MHDIVHCLTHLIHIFQKFPLLPSSGYVVVSLVFKMSQAQTSLTVLPCTLIFNPHVSYYIPDMNMATPQPISVTYSGNKDISRIFKACYTISVLFPAKCHLFHNFISFFVSSNNLVFYKACAKFKYPLLIWISVTRKKVNWNITNWNHDRLRKQKSFNITSKFPISVSTQWCGLWYQWWSYYRNILSCVISIRFFCLFS